MKRGEARPIYDEIGVGYGQHRRSDPRIEAALHAALGPGGPLVNVGAGAGSYEPTDRPVFALELSREMIAQRPSPERVVRGNAIRLPFADDAFETALAILTIHHWPDREQGLREMARVARERVVVLTFDAEMRGFWLTDDYFPAIRALDLTTMPPIDTVCGVLEGAVAQPLEVPHDCVDGFLGAYWRRPERYLDPSLRAVISAFRQIPPEAVDEGVERLRRDLEDGSWERKHGAVRARDTFDVGYRLVVARHGGA